MKLVNRKSSVFFLRFHLILVTKKRRKIIDEEVSEYLKEHFLRIGEHSNVEIIEWHYQPDHIHIVFDTQPKINITKFVGAYKSAVSRKIKYEKFHVNKRMENDQQFWSRSFCIYIDGSVSDDEVEKFIESQERCYRGKRQERTHEAHTHA